LYWFKTWFLTLREEHRLRVFENRVLKRITGPKRDEITGEWGKLHNEELHNFYSSPNINMHINSRSRGMWHILDTREKFTRFWWETPKERHHLEDRSLATKI
jgi:hypothetical protein